MSCFNPHEENHRPPHPLSTWIAADPSHNQPLSHNNLYVLEHNPQISQSQTTKQLSSTTHWLVVTDRAEFNVFLLPRVKITPSTLSFHPTSTLRTLKTERQDFKTTCISSTAIHLCNPTTTTTTTLLEACKASWWVCV